MKKHFLKIALTLFLSTFVSILFSQSISVKGYVYYAANKSPIKGATIIKLNSHLGDISDEKGFFEIKANKGDTLEVSFIGCKTKQIVVTQSSVKVGLEKDSLAIEDVIVITGSNPSLGQVSRMANYNYEEYSKIDQNKFVSVVKEPLSTFSADVDAASYANVRRYINQGTIPPKDAVCTEELVNYFSYDYPSPTDKQPIRIMTEAAACPWNSDHRLVRIALKAKEIDATKLLPSNFTFLIDVSGSMFGPTRLDLVKSSLKLLVNNLRDCDNVAIVVYAGRAGLVLPPTKGSDKQKIKDALESLTAGGSTAGGAGIELAYKIAADNFIKKGNNRVILCSDGDFNVGTFTPEGLEQLIETKRKTGVFLTVLGYGMGNYKNNRMQVLAEKGNGNHAYIDNLQEANRVLVGEFGSTMHTVAKDVKLQVEFNPDKVQAYRLIGYESRLLAAEDFNNDAKDGGELGAGHTMTAFYEIVPAGVKSDFVGKVDDLKYQKKQDSQKSNASDEMLTVKVRYKQPDGDISMKMDLPFIDNGKENVSSDFKFASAVAMFGQLLRDSEYKGEATYDKVIELAKYGLDNDSNGYRREFIRLVKTVKGLE